MNIKIEMGNELKKEVWGFKIDFPSAYILWFAQLEFKNGRWKTRRLIKEFKSMPRLHTIIIVQLKNKIGDMLMPKLYDHYRIQF